MESLPVHVGMIMDGNARWALSKGLPKIEGYRQGAKIVTDVALLCVSWRIKYLTLYAFSIENWQRNIEDIEALFALFVSYYDECIDHFIDSGIVVNFIGDLTRLPLDVKKLILNIESRVPNNVKCILNIAISYGGRQEICNALSKIIDLKTKSQDLTVDLINSMLYTCNVPDPDLIIRTGGEKRLSNFLLWQSAYSELYFCDTMWPDFNKDCFEDAINDYKRRVRKYGK